MNRQYRSVISILFPPPLKHLCDQKEWRSGGKPTKYLKFLVHWQRMLFLSPIIQHKEQWQLHSVHRPVTWDWEFTELELVLHVRSLQQFFLLSLTIERKLQLMSSSSWWKLTILIVSFAIESSSNFHLNFDVWTAGLWVFLDQLAKGDIRGVVYFWSCANIWSKGSNVQ